MQRNNDFSRLELNLQNSLYNYRYFRAKIKPQTKLLVLVKANAYGHGAVEFAAAFTLEDEEVELPIVVGHRALQSVAHACGDRQGPYYPVVMAEEVAQPSVAKVQLSEDESEVDGNKPQVATHAVEYAANLRILLGDARQLTVGAIVGVGPNN